jgi:hypothetical protein
VTRRPRQRDFVDRGDAIARFERVFAEQSSQEPRLLNYFGVGGIGKSRLQQELRKQLQAQRDALSVRLDLQVPAMRRQDAALA